MFTSAGLTPRFVIVSKGERKEKFPFEYRDDYVGYYDYLKMVGTSRAILDIAQQKQDGYSMRVMSTSEIGVVNLYNSWHSMLNAVVTLGEAVCAHVVCKKERGANYEVYNDKAVGLMAVMAILLCFRSFRSASRTCMSTWMSA